MARSSGKKLERPKRTLDVSRLDGTVDDIPHFFKPGMQRSSIAKIMGVTRPTLYSFIATRGLRPGVGISTRTLSVP